MNWLHTTLVIVYSYPIDSCESNWCDLSMHTIYSLFDIIRFTLISQCMQSSRNAYNNYCLADALAYAAIKLRKLT